MSHPEITSDDVEQPIPKDAATVRREVRETVWSIFSKSARFIGRNSAEAIKADLKTHVRALHLHNYLPIFKTEKGRGKNSRPEDYISQNIVNGLDSDQKQFAYDVDIYNFLNNNGEKKLHPLYNALHRKTIRH